MNCKNACLESIVILALVISSALGLNCYACLPDIVGGTISQEIALKWTANISRMWNERRQSSFGFCSAWSQDQMFQVTCPNYGEQTACISGIRRPVGSRTLEWEAMTCGAVTSKGEGCFTDSDRVSICYCTSDYCNEGTVGQHSVLGIVFFAVFNIIMIFNWY